MGGERWTSEKIWRKIFDAAGISASAGLPSVKNAVAGKAQSADVMLRRVAAERRWGQLSNSPVCETLALNCSIISITARGPSHEEPCVDGSRVRSDKHIVGGGG